MRSPTRCFRISYSPSPLALTSFHAPKRIFLERNLNVGIAAAKRDASFRIPFERSTPSASAWRVAALHSGDCIVAACLSKHFELDAAEGETPPPPTHFFSEASKEQAELLCRSVQIAFTQRGSVWNKFCLNESDAQAKQLAAVSFLLLLFTPHG